jgi:DNA-binding NtrC family response regulator
VKILPYVHREPGSILLADADKRFCAAMSGHLAKAGYHSRCIHKGKIDVLVQELEFIQLAAINYAFPGISVTAFARAALETDIPVILIAESASPRIERNARALSPVFFFIKPFEAGDFIAVIDRVLKRGYTNVTIDYR